MIEKFLQNIHSFLNVQMNQINIILWLDLTCFPILTLNQKIIVIWHRNWIINTIGGQWTWRRHSNYFYPLPWSAPNLCCSVTICLSCTCAIHYFCSNDKEFWVRLLWKGVDLLVLLVLEVLVVVKYKRQ